MGSTTRLFLTLLLISSLLPSSILPSVIINEIMNNPAVVSDADGEWFELHNTGEDTVDLNGWVIRDNGQDYHEISAQEGAYIEPGGYFVLGRRQDPAINGGYRPDYVYQGIILSNEEDEIILVDPLGRVADSVAYGAGWPVGSGRSMEFIEEGTDNSRGEEWAPAVSSYGDGDLGTPGAKNDASALGITEGVSNREGVNDTSSAFFLTYPNPFAGYMTVLIEADLTLRSTLGQDFPGGPPLKLSVYDLRGRKVRELWRGRLTSETRITWNGRDDRGNPLPPGIYLMHLSGGTLDLQRKVILMAR
jgi:hypothetical protein